MHIQKGILGFIIATSVAISAYCPAQAHQVDLLRSIPLEISGYEEAKALPEKFSTAEDVLKAIDATENLLIHMEVLRRSYHDLPADEQEKLLATLQKRHQQHEHDLRLSFDHGYAQLVHKHNKTGLFFLRKVNDRFQNQFSSLAYGMAEVEADLNLEAASPDEMTVRKLDATYQLSDAVKRDALNHQPGFWPTYVRVIEKIKPLGAYSSFSRRDFSLVYLPYGNNVVPMSGPSNQTALPLTDNPKALLSNTLNTSCDPAGLAETEPEGSMLGKALSERNVPLEGDSALIQFFPTDETGLYRVRVLRSDGQPMLSFKTHSMSSVVEDLDGDGVYEIVARQYKQDPLNPVLVYRYTPCGFELDRKISETFK